MVGSFIAACSVVCIALYVPGFITLKAMRLSSWQALAFAPLVSIVFYCLGGVVFEKMGVFASVWSIGALALALALIILVVAVILRRRHPARALAPCYERSTFDRFIPLAYIAFGVLIGSIVYLGGLPSVENVAETWDNVFHYGLVRTFVESGSWSTLNANSAYLDTAGVYPAPFGVSGGYYPAAWHLVCALPVSLLGVSVPIAVNATNFVFLSVVYALGMWMLIRELFAGNKALVALGVFVSFAFGVCPWVLLTHWPLFPNFISLTMVPLLCAAFLLSIRGSMPVKRRIGFTAIFILGVLAEAFCQPNAVFGAAVVLAPLVVCRGASALAGRFGGGRSTTKHALVAIVAGVTITALIAALWFIAFKLPFLQPTVNFYWAPITTVKQALFSVVSLSFGMGYPQYFLALLVVVGALYILVKRRDLAWLLVSYAFAAAIFVVAASFGDVWIKHFLAGFWYTDPYRVMTTVGLVGVPIALCGLFACCKFVQWAIAKIVAAGRRRPFTLSKVGAASVNVVVVVISCVLIYSFAPIGSSKMPMFAHLNDIVGAHAAGNENALYDDEERRFVEEVKAIIDEDDLVLNHPFDGSMLAYGMSDLPAYYRSISGYGTSGEIEESTVLRERLSALSSDEEVQAAIRETGADYVLILENDTDRMAALYLSYGRAPWTGFEAIDEATPGFELVLEGGEEGDMRLYKIATP